MQKYLIFGATGSVGSNLATQLSQSNKEIHLIGRNDVELEKLSSGPNNVLWYDEIGKDSSDVNQYWINQCISDGLELGFEIRLKK